MDVSFHHGKSAMTATRRQWRSLARCDNFALQYKN